VTDLPSLAGMASPNGEPQVRCGVIVVWRQQNSQQQQQRRRQQQQQRQRLH
jgi:hypothetical protein